MQKVLLAVIAASIVTIGLTVNFAGATHQPADKAQASADDVDHVGASGDRVLYEQMKVSTTSDLILQTSAECSILTSLYTAGGPETQTESDGAFGQVKLYIKIDGTRVPVSTNDSAINEQGDDDEGEIVFCNRAYQRTVTDNEQDEDDHTNDDVEGSLRDGLDTEDDFIRTRTANAFNWMAFDVGATYDKPYNGNNIVDVELYAEYDRSTATTTNGEADEVTGNGSCGDRHDDDDLTPYGATCADAFVGSRSLIIEAVHASNHEQPAPEGDDPESGIQLP